MGDYLVSAKLKYNQSMDDQSHLVFQVFRSPNRAQNDIFHGPDQHSSA